DRLTTVKSITAALPARRYLSRHADGRRRQRESPALRLPIHGCAVGKEQPPQERQRSDLEGHEPPQFAPQPAPPPRAVHAPRAPRAATRIRYHSSRVSCTEYALRASRLRAEFWLQM